ncbi:tetratricopeptide repeat-containing sulfotransferase family protein [Cognatishimia sp. WU-CL00825]|uniref:tetratricopeptide repeat-containing sulfotransferase family protein n=1 Tax=Cognatishimia sp. WU-CL00825 TaxID=3127658 RepID=UPI003104D551
MQPIVKETQKASELHVLQRLLNKGQFRQLHKMATRAQRRFPEEAVIQGFLGAASTGLGRLRQAIVLYKRGIAMDASISMLHRDLGNLYLAVGQNALAATCFVTAQKLGPSDADLTFRLGTALMRSNRLREALTQLGAALARDPKNPIYAGTLAEAFELAGLFEEAIKSYEIALKLSQNNQSFQLALGRCCYNSGQAEKALEIAEQGLKSDPASEQFYGLKAAALGALGRIDQANNSHRDAIVLGKPQGNHFYNFALRHDMCTEPEISERITGALDLPQSQRDAKYLHFAMAKLCEDNANYDRAYAHYCEGNALQKQYLAYDVGRDIALFEKLKTAFAVPTPNLAQARRAAGPRPIFIVGMPRSGTTLAEAILARHPDVMACGETSALLQSVVTCLPNQEAPDVDQAAALRQDYLRRLPPCARQTAFFTDKMPTNFRLIGHILMAIPDACVIHMRRDANAVCWSNFRTLYSSMGNGFSYDPEDLVSYYKAYQQLMAFWQTRFPSRIYSLDYEQLVRGPENTIRNLLVQVGLSWHAACLSPEKGNQPVTTASQSQVRKKIYQGSSKAWLQYKSLAGEWMDKLNEGENASKTDHVEL